MFAAAHTVRLAGEADFDGFRRQARALLAQGVAPEDVAFSTDGAPADSSAGLDVSADAAGPAGPDAPGAPEAPEAPEAPDAADAAPPGPLRLGAVLLHMLGQAALHAEPQRFALAYRLLWRIARQPALQRDPLDPDRLRLEAMAQAVRRDLHKMKAFVRFRPLAEPGAGDPLHVAWFEPAHHIVEAVAPFFVRRFAGMRFAVLTPRRSLRWDGQALQFGPGAQRADAPGADAGEALWLTYYAHIFNPARLKLQAMASEMPRRYWKNLPEAVLIAPLAAAATARAGAMLAAPATVPLRRIPAGARAPDAPGAAVHASGAAGPDDHWPPPPADAPAADRLVLLQQRRRLADQCRACPIGALATQTVHGEGPVDARIMVVGEQPGDAEDLRGRPFVGPSGQLFDRALAALGWPREALYISNAVRHFKYLPRGRRRLHQTPAQQEAAACLHWLDEEIALVRPAVLVALGATAARALLGAEVAVMSARGRWFVHPASGTPVRVALHPSALLRLPGHARAAAFDDWVRDLGAAGAPPDA